MESSRAVEVLGALAQEARLGIFRALVVAGPDGLAAGELASRLDIAPATLSFHLKELRHAGLVHAESRGRARIYRPEFGAVREIAAFLLEDCCRGC